MRIWKLRRYLLPLLIVSFILLEYSGILHLSYIHIKSHELKWTELAMNYHPRDGDLFTAAEIVSQNNYEDAVFAFRPNYDELLSMDLKEIALNREHIDRIDNQELSFYSGPYRIQACLDKKNIEIKDSTLFRKIVDVEILGNYELYDDISGTKLYDQSHQKFWIRDQIIIRGRSRKPFIRNKISEIWLAQMSNNAHKIIRSYEAPRQIATEVFHSKEKWEEALSNFNLDADKIEELNIFGQATHSELKHKEE